MRLVAEVACILFPAQIQSGSAALLAPGPSSINGSRARAATSVASTSVSALTRKPVASSCWVTFARSCSPRSRAGRALGYGRSSSGPAPDPADRDSRSAESTADSRAPSRSRGPRRCTTAVTATDSPSAPPNSWGSPRGRRARRTRKPPPAHSPGPSPVAPTASCGRPARATARPSTRRSPRTRHRKLPCNPIIRVVWPCTPAMQRPPMVELALSLVRK